MSLLLNFGLCVTNGCTQLEFSETTGVYSVSNTTGWGSPNPIISDALTATLSITGPDAIVYTIDLFATSLFPSSNSDLSYNISLSDIGNPTTITDGQWTFTYTVTTVSTTYTRTIVKYFYCNSECCIKKMQANVTPCDCCKNDKTTMEYITAWTMLQSLIAAAKCGNFSDFSSIKKIIDKLCLNNGCKTCK